MSEQIARAHTSQTNRARPRNTGDRKIVFKSVVENPFRVQWPSVPINVQNAVLACVVDMLVDVAPYHLSREDASRRKRRAVRLQRRSAKRQKVQSDEDIQSGEEADGNEPPILKHVRIGINEVTRQLEAIAKSARTIITPAAVPSSALVPSSDSSTSSNRIVLVCRADIDPPVLVGHLPSLIAVCNSCHRPSPNGSSGKTWLIPMPKGAEDALSAALALRRVAVLLIEDTAPNFHVLASLLQTVAMPSAPWPSHSTSSQPTTLIPTHIKQLRTTAPKDMKVAKERRSTGRAAAKERRKLTIPARVTLSTPSG